MERLSVLPVSLFSSFRSGAVTIADWAQMAKKIGLSYIDVPNWAFQSHTPVYLNRLKTELQCMGMRLAMVGAYPDFTNPDPLQRERELDYLKRDIALSSQMGARYLRVTDGQAHPGVSREQGVSWALEGLAKAAQSAKQYGVQLAFENHGHPSAWIYDDFSHPVSIFLELAEALQGTGVGVNFDSGNATGCGVDALWLLKQVYGSVVSLHISDTASNITTQHTALGGGASPIGEILAYLKKNNYQGWFSIEEDSNNGMDGIYQSVAYVNGLWDAIS